MIKLKFKTLDHIVIIYKFIEESEFNSGNKYLDNLVNSIIEDIALKLYNKYQKESLRTMNLKKHEALALWTYYYSKTIRVDAYEAAFINQTFNFIHQKIV